MEKIKNFIVVTGKTLKQNLGLERIKVPLLMAILLLLLFCSKLPYLNILFNGSTIPVIVIILLTIFFNLGNRIFFILAWTCLFLSLPFLLFQEQKIAESFGSLAYLFIACWLIKELWRYKRATRLKRNH